MTRKRVQCKPSPVFYHLLLNNHDNDFNDFTLLCRDNGFRFLLKESEIPVLNKKTASIPLLLFD